MTSDDPRLPQMTLKILLKNCLETVTIRTKFQVHTKVYTNMTSDDLWMTSHDLENIIKKLTPISYYTHQVSSSYQSLS